MHIDNFKLSPKRKVPIVTKFNIEPPGADRTKYCLNGLGHMADMVTMPI